MFKYNFGADRSRQFSYPYTGHPETKQLPFYLSVIGDFDCGGDYYTERSAREEYLMLYTLGGEGELTCGNDHVLLPKGSLVVFDCRKYHIYHTHGENWHFLWVHFNGEGVPPYLQAINGDGLHILYPEEGSLESWWGKLRDKIAENGKYTHFEISNLLSDMLTSWVCLSRYTEGESPVHGRIEKVRLYMEQHFAEPLGVDDLAALCGLSKYHFIRVFRAVTGSAPGEYLRLFRINRAKEWLIGTDLPVSEIAARTGFGESKILIGALKKAAGMTPLQYRSAYAGKKTERRREPEWSE